MSVMPRPRPPHLHQQMTRHGRTVWYVRVGHGKRIRIQGEYGSAEFQANYQAAISGESPPQAGIAGKTGTLRWLVEQWMGSADWLNTKPTTRKQRENILIAVLESAGDKPFGKIGQKHVEDGMRRRRETPFAADNFLKVMRALFKWAVASKHVGENPASAVPLLNRNTDGFPPWSVEDVERFRDRWPLGTQQRLALELLFATGLRRGDAVRLGRQHVKDGLATLKAEKTGTELYVPIAPALQAAIDACGHSGTLTYLATEYGHPRTKEGFGTWFREACDKAGVTGSAHGLRKLRATLMAEDGASEKELNAAFGWTTSTMSQLYTRSADRKRLSIQAARRLNGEHPIPSPQNKVRELG